MSIGEVVDEVLGLFRLQTNFGSFSSAFYGCILPSKLLILCTKFLPFRVREIFLLFVEEGILDSVSCFSN